MHGGPPVKFCVAAKEERRVSGCLMEGKVVIIWPRTKKGEEKPNPISNETFLPFFSRKKTIDATGPRLVVNPSREQSTELKQRGEERRPDHLGSQAGGEPRP